MIALVKYGLVALAGASVPTVIAAPVTTTVKNNLTKLWEAAKKELDKVKQDLKTSKEKEDNLNNKIQTLEKSIKDPGIADILNYFDIAATSSGLKDNFKEYDKLSEKVDPKANCLLTETTKEGTEGTIYLWSCKYIKPTK